MSNKAEKFRSLPAVDDVLSRTEIAELLGRHPRPLVVQWVRAAIDRCRQRIVEGDATDADGIVDDVRRSAVLEQSLRLQPVINATGVLLHTNLGRAPLADQAVQRMSQASAYGNVELNLHSGKRSRRGERAMRLMAQLSGAEDAIVVNNCAGATMLVLQAIAGGREVIISRGQLVEIGGGFRLPEVFSSAGVTLREVGTTNRTYLRDYENAVGENTGALIRVHRSNFAQSGFVTEPSIDELVGAERPDGVPVIDDVGSGCFEDLSSLGLHEPIVTQSVAAGADMTLFSGDKLFGGPQCGVVVGRARWIALLRRSPIARAVRVDKVTLAALEATAEIHLDGRAREELPLLRMMFLSAEDIRLRCESVAGELSQASGFDVQVVACESQIGGGAIPGGTLPSYAVRVSGGSSEALAAHLRQGPVAVQSRVAQDCLMLDLRTVSENQSDALARALDAALSACSGNA